jgi:UDP:flavonoid glycosyltransferase YjiC (YdhE family)
MAEKLKILICPLNWGLGHAARDVPIIERLLEKGHTVELAGDGTALELLKAEFPGLKTHPFRSLVRIRYSLHLPAWLKITILSPLLLYEIITEHFRFKRILRRTKPRVVISDNRYGLWNHKVLSILVTHQISLKLPGFIKFLEYPVYLAMKMVTGSFDRCWIPDFPGEQNLSGELSHRYKTPRNAVFIGAVSRFAPRQRGTYAVEKEEESIDLSILLSGPEPQRSQLQKIVLKQVLHLECRCVILQGIPGKTGRTDLTSYVTMYSHLNSSELRNLLRLSKYVICRSGYTGIMDLALMKKKAMIIPTPGQTEQEYLARFLTARGMFLSCRQEDLELGRAIGQLSEFNPALNLFPVELPVADLPREESAGGPLGEVPPEKTVEKSFDEVLPGKTTSIDLLDKEISWLESKC